MKQISKRHMLAVIWNSRLSEKDRNQLLQEMLSNGEITEGDLAQFFVDDVDKNFDQYRKLFEEDEMILFLRKRFKGYESYLARALVRVRPDVFYTYGFAFRVVIKLQANLGQVYIPPGSNGNLRTSEQLMNALPEAVQQDIFQLDVECRFRLFLDLFSHDTFENGMSLLEDEINLAISTYDRKVFEAVAKLIRRIMNMQLPGVKSKINNRSFPALHVRWWLEKSKHQDRVLNMGGTGTYKTSYAAIAMRLSRCKRVLVICAPHARMNWKRELGLYFEKKPRVQVITSKHQLDELDPDAEYTVIGYSTLAACGAVDMLLERGYDGVIQDECHYGKSVRDAANPVKRAQACLDLLRGLELKKFIALSATPWENRPEEMAAVVCALKPDLFASPEDFLLSGAAKNARFLRELLADHILEIESREIANLPPIKPLPWDDLFGAMPIDLIPDHRTVYQAVYAQEDFTSSQKIMGLLMAATHPALLDGREFLQDPDHAALARDWQTSSKLVWIKRFIEGRISNSKIVVFSGLYATGITRFEEETDPDVQAVAELLREWFGKQSDVLVIDGKTKLKGKNGAKSERDQLIRRWRTDPKARILLISMRTCPDSINLSIRAQPGIERLFITGLCFDWKPWEQFLGRFWRQGQSVPIEYCVPIIQHTIDESLLRMLQKKWHAQRLFKAMAPMTDEELRYLRPDGVETLRKLMYSSTEYVCITQAQLRSAGEELCALALNEPDGAVSRGRLFAEHWLKIQSRSASGHIARWMKKGIERLEELGLVHRDNILDAGCGTLQLERELNAPIHGIDMNPHMIEIGRRLSPHGGRNVRAGRISDMPAEWTGKFELTVASMVLDMSSMLRQINGMPERLWLLCELIRVTNPQGLIWLTWSVEYQDEKTFANWVKALRREGFIIKEEQTWSVKATDHPDHRFMFWSILFSPNGRVPRFDDPPLFAFPWELARKRFKIGGGQRNTPKPHQPSVEHREFEVITPTGTLNDQEAASKSARSEIMRILTLENGRRVIHRSLEEISALLGTDWRFLDRAYRRGVVNF